MTQDINKTGVGERLTRRSRLTLYPSDPHYAWVDNIYVVGTLRERGFIADRLDQRSSELYFQCGDRFLSLITFLGCAPNIAFEPHDDGRAFCFIHMPAPAVLPVAHFGVNAKSALCPTCKYPVHAFDEVTEICCSHCGTPAQAWRLNWRKTACWARVVINVWNVFESEAVPGDQLLETLLSVSGVPWSYCYIRT